MIAVEALTVDQRLAVEHELATRLRAEDGAFGSTTLAALIQSDMVDAKTTISSGDNTLYGVLIEWPGYTDPQFLAISDALWRAVELPDATPPAG